MSGTAGSGDASLAAALFADHVEHAEVAITWLAESADDGWRIVHANPAALVALGLDSVAAARAIELAPGIDRLTAPLANRLDRAELVRALRLAAHHADETPGRLSDRLGPRFMSQPFDVAGLRGITVIARSGDLAAELRRSAEVARRIMSTYFEHAGVEVFMKDLDGRYMLANDNFRAAWQRQGDDLTGLTDDEIVGPQLAERYRAEDERVLRANTPLEFEGVTELADGEHVFRVVKFPVHDADGVVIGVGGVATDVTESIRSRAALAVSEEQFRLAFEHASEGIAIVSTENTLLQVNDRLCEMLGRTREELIGWPGESLYPSGDQISFEEWTRAAKAHGHTVFERVVAKPDGTEVHVRVSAALVADNDGTPLHYVAMISDETERRLLELRARQVEKLDAVGQLAGGIAHDINNLLGGILGYAELVKSAQTDPDVAEQCEQVIGAALRAADYTGRLLSFARPAESVSDRFDMHDLIAEVAHMLRHSTDPRVEVTTELGAAQSVVDGNPNQLHGALLNLGLNARDAIAGSGTISIRTTAGREPGTIRVEIADSGAGIPPEHLSRIFDPFFTTKAADRGTGLGLTSVLAAAHQHGGTVTVESDVGRGSTFVIELPVVDRRRRPAAPDTGAGLVPGTRVLVVDDDELVRRAVAESLRRAGCDVAEVGDGVAAIEAIEAAPAPFEAAVFDLRMPRMGGDALFDVIHRRWPTIATVLMSGFTGDEGAEALRERGVGAVLQKPFKADELMTALARCIERH